VAPRRVPDRRAARRCRPAPAVRHQVPPPGRRAGTAADRARRERGPAPRRGRPAAARGLCPADPEDVRMITWDPVVRAHRAREVGRLRAARPLAALTDRAWRAVIEASAPFRLGMRVGAVPDVQLYAGDALVVSPGDRLPGPDDRSLDDYVARLTGE